MSSIKNIQKIMMRFWKILIYCINISVNTLREQYMLPKTCGKKKDYLMLLMQFSQVMKELWTTLCNHIWQSRKTQITKHLTCQENRKARKTLSYNEIISHTQKPNICWWLCQTFEGMTFPTITQSFDIRRGGGTSYF